MSTLAAWLHDGTTGELLHNLPRFFVIVAIALALAWVAGFVARRWLRGLGAAAAAESSRVVRPLQLFVVAGGLYEAVEELPLGPGAASKVGGALYVLAVLFAARLVLRGFGVLVRGYFERFADRGDGIAHERAQREYLPLASTTATAAVGLLAIILVAHHFGNDVTTLVTAFGVGSLAFGLAAQATLGNTIAGFILLIDRPFRPGDRVRLQSGEAGQILEIGMRSTRIELPEGTLLIVPNAEMANTRVVNLSAPTPTRAEVRMKVAWSRAIDELARALEATARALPEVAKEPAPRVVVGQIEAAQVELALQFHVVGEGRAQVEEQLRRAVVERLAADLAKAK